MSAPAVWGRVSDPSRPSPARQEGVAAGDSPARIALNPAPRQSHRQSSEQRTPGAKRHAFCLVDGTTKVVPFPSRAQNHSVAASARVVPLQTGIRVFPQAG